MGSILGKLIMNYFKREILNIVGVCIFKPYHDYLGSVLNSIIKCNAEILDGAFAEYGFIFNKIPYTNIDLWDTYSLPALHSSLHSTWNEYAISKEKYKEDTRRINQIIKTMLAKAETKQDLFDALPDDLYSVYPELRAVFPKEFKRTRPEAFLILDMKNLYNEYLECKELLFSYIGNQLIV